MKRHLIAAACALIAGTAFAANPTASLNRTFTEYTLGGPIGNDNINDNSNVYWFYESTGTWLGQAVNSWFVFWDPKNSLGANGTITFDQPILFVHDVKSELVSTASFQKLGVTYNYPTLVGLESNTDTVTKSGKVLTLDWMASNPGDHIRVMTAVPEPSAYALSGAALLVVMGFVGRRRRAG